MEEVQESPTRISKWKTIFIIGFTVIAVSGMMYMLFTDDEYNIYASPPSSSSADSGKGNRSDTTSYTASASTSEAQNSYTATTSANQASSPNALQTSEPVATNSAPSKVVAETKPTVVEQKPPVVEQKPATAVVKAPPVPKTEAKPTVVKPQPVAPKPVEKPMPIKTTMASVANTKIVKPAKPVAKPLLSEDKVMTDGELQQIASSIIEKGKAAGVYPKCVQLRSTTGGNNKATMRQIELFLRNQNFTIAGRQTVSGRVSGYQVTPIEGCMRLTVGSF